MDVLYEPQLCLEVFNPMGIAVFNMAVKICLMHYLPLFACLRQGEAPGFLGDTITRAEGVHFFGVPQKSWMVMENPAIEWMI